MKKIFVVLMSLMFIMFLAGCKKEKQYSDEAVCITINKNYKEEFLNRSFDLTDFKHENIKFFTYSKWDENEDKGYLFVYIKKTGKKEISRIIVHLKTLNFVEECEKMPIFSLIE